MKCASSSDAVRRGFGERKFKNMGKCSAYKVLLVQLLSQKAVSCEGGDPGWARLPRQGASAPAHLAVPARHGFQHLWLSQSWHTA